MDTQARKPAQLPFAGRDALNSGDVDSVLALFSPGATMRTLLARFCPTRASCAQKSPVRA